MKDAFNAVPDNFPHRLSIITSLINQVLSNPVTEIQCSALLNALKTSSLKDHVASSSDGSLLWSTALASGQPVKFLTPPVSTCRNVACKLFNMDGSLSAHHDPTQATIYTLDGQVPAQKVSLRCKNCGWIYGYSMYGRKQHGGMSYHDSERSLIEVTDTIFCDGKLHELYCSLR